MARDMRAHLLETALSLFAARGYEGTGVQDIVEQAGVTKPTLYHHFGSKKGLLSALLLEHSASFLARLRAEVDAYAGDLPFTLDRIAALYFDFAAHSVQFYRLHLALQHVPLESEAREAAEQLSRGQQASLEHLFTNAVAQHGNMRGRHERYAHALLGVLNAYAGLIITGRVRPTAQLRRELVHQFSHGIYS